MGLIMITVYRTLCGPYETNEGVIAVMQTSDGDEEIYFDSFHDWYEMDLELPCDYDDDDLPEIVDEDTLGDS